MWCIWVSFVSAHPPVLSGVCVCVGRRFASGLDWAVWCFRICYDTSWEIVLT